MNPYWDADFWRFISLFCTRLPSWLRGDLASDEIQVFVLVGIALSSALIGTFLVFKKMVMFANAISHTVLLGIAIVYAALLSLDPQVSLHPPLLLLFAAALATSLLTALLTHLFVNVFKVQEDASIGLVFTSLFALGIVVVSLFMRNAHIGVEIIMGNVDALHSDDLKRAAGILLCNLLAIGLFFKEWVAVSFDPGFARSSGVSTRFFHLFLMTLTAATCIAAFRAVGVILVIAFLVGPPLIARLWTHHLRRVLLYAALVAAGASFVGVALSRHLLSVYSMPVSTGGLVVFLLGLCYLLSLLVIRCSRKAAVLRGR